MDLFKQTVQEISKQKGIPFDEEKDTVQKMVYRLEKRISSKYKYYRYTVKNLKEECDKEEIKYEHNAKKMDLITKLITKHDSRANKEDYFRYNLHNLKLNVFYANNIYLEYRFPYYFALFKYILKQMPEPCIDGIGFLIFTYTLHSAERYFIGKKLLSLSKSASELYQESKLCKESKEELLLLCKEIGIRNLSMRSDIRQIRTRLFVYSFGNAVLTYLMIIGSNSPNFPLLSHFVYHNILHHGYCYDDCIGSLNDRELNQFLKTLK